MSVDERPPLRETIAAFQQGAKRELSQHGWRKRTGGIFTLDLDDGYFAWLGLNTATKYRPMSVNPGVGTGHVGTSELLNRFAQPTEATRYVRPLVSLPLGRIRRIRRGEPLGAPGHWHLEFDLPEEVPTEVATLVKVLEEDGIPFARHLADPDAMAVALQDTNLGPLSDSLIERLPTFLAAIGHKTEALTELHRLLEEQLGSRTDPASEHYRRFAAGFENWLAANGG